MEEKRCEYPNSNLQAHGWIFTTPLASYRLSGSEKANSY
jgi:hypothetical protein